MESHHLYNLLRGQRASHAWLHDSGTCRCRPIGPLPMCLHWCLK